MLKKFLPLVIFLVLVGFLGAGLTLNPQLVPSPLIDKPAPEFILPQVGEPARRFSSADLRGQVSLLNVWASWCVACRSEHPVLMALAKRNIVPIYGLNYKDETADAVRWLNYFGDPYTTSIQDYSGKVGIDFGVYGVPETFVIDATGIIRYKFVGPVTEEVLSKDILPMVKKLQASL